MMLTIILQLLLLLLAIVANFSVADNLELTGNLRKHQLEGHVYSTNKTSTLSGCLCNWAVGCASNSDCCPGLQCNLFNGWSQCLEPAQYQTSNGTCVTNSQWGCSSNGCCNPSAICGSSDGLCLLSCQRQSPPTTPPVAKPTTLSPTLNPTSKPTTASPTVKSTSSFPVKTPTIKPTVSSIITTKPTTVKPSLNPRTASPVANPTTLEIPSSLSPINANPTTTTPICMCNWAVGCASNNDCCPGLQCNLFNGWSQCLEPTQYQTSNGTCVTNSQWGCSSNGCCNPSAVCGSSDGLCLLSCQRQSSPTTPPVAKPTTLSPTLNPTSKPTTASPTVKSTSSFPVKTPTIKPTVSSTTTKPTTVKPSLNPTTASPSTMPTTSMPVTKPSVNPTMSSTTTKPSSSSPTLKPTTCFPSIKPTTLPPTFTPSNGAPTFVPSVTTAAPGYLSTSGNQIVNNAGIPVRIAGINFWGFSTSLYVFHGLWIYSLTGYLNKIKSLGFNTLRIDMCNDMLRVTTTSLNINYAANPDLVGLNPLQVLDKTISYCTTLGLKIILERHSAKADAYTYEDLWYIPGDPVHTEAQFISDWVFLAQRYLNNPTVIGIDLFNEPKRSATWGNQNPTTDWNKAAERCGNAILAANPNLLIFVEGINWGGDLSGVANYPVQLSVPNKLVYSAHTYPSSVIGPAAYFFDPNYPNNLNSVWDGQFGFIYRNNIAPVWIGEFGSKLLTTSDIQWMTKFKAYVNGDMNFNGGSIAPPLKSISYTYWCWNPNSGDTGGILKDDWQTVDYNKMSYLVLDSLIV